MRWERLFDDLEAQLDALSAAELAGEVAERTRYERAQLTLADRLVAWVGEPVTLDLLGGASVTGRLSQAAEEWVVVLHGPRPALVPTSAIVAINGWNRIAIGFRAVPGSYQPAAARGAA